MPADNPSPSDAMPIRPPIERRAIWSTFAGAIGAELRTDTVIRGSSGLEHPVEAIAVDEVNDRVIIVAAEPNPRMAAMMQVDVQTTLAKTRVLVARPVAVDLPTLVRKVAEPFGITEIEFAKARSWLQAQRERTPKADGSFEELGIDEALGSSLALIDAIPPMNQILGFAMQAGELPWNDIGRIFGETTSAGTLDLRALLATNSLAADLQAGVCPVPLYEFDADAVEMFLRGSDLDAARAHLKALGIYQYFYPSRDQVALGLVDQGIREGARIAEVGGQAPDLGHPFGNGELVEDAGGFVAAMSSLKDEGYLVEGEFGLEVSLAGRTVRSSIKVRPREGLLAKLLNTVKISISPTDLFK